jgi:hypothetical protein
MAIYFGKPNRIVLRAVLLKTRLSIYHTVELSFAPIAKGLDNAARFYGLLNFNRTL